MNVSYKLCNVNEEIDKANEHVIFCRWENVPSHEESIEIAA